ncbi:hypothetical protein IQ255_04955 [Pleurocapsales cyanobacterium LEGE 10410]|nr:hypothetical protein [Pleurocapsales cyanobacterium LEGE 10410]
MNKFDFTQVSSFIAPPFTSFTAGVINERSDVAFEGFLSPELPPFAIFYANNYQDDVSTGTFIDNSEAFLTTGEFKPVFEPSINDLGQAAFIQSETSLLTDENGAPVLDENGEPIIQFDRITIQVGDGEQEPVVVLESTDAFNAFAGVNLNNRGTISYAAGNFLNVPVDFPVTSGIYTLSDGETTEIASTDGIFSSFDVSLDVLGGDGPITSLDISPALNEHDEVAFNAGLDAGGQGIFVGDGETITEVANSEGEFDLFSYPDLNDEGTTAFLVQRDDGTRGIYTNSYGETELLVDDSGKFDFFSSETALNNNGEVAFYAELDDGSAGIYVASELGITRVASVGDEIAGSTVGEITFVQEAFNDLGQVAVQARLEDGTFAIFRADPISNPTRKHDRLYGDSGNNHIDGKGGKDLIVGGLGNDTLLGGRGKDILRGGEGDDILKGGKGHDTLVGGADADIFKITSGRGEDLILDYVNGVDKLSLYGDVQFSHLNISQQDDNTEISLSSTGEVLASLYEVDASVISPSDFV